MRRALASGVVAVLAATLLAGPAVADEVDASSAVTFPVEDIVGEVRDLTFPEANLDGSVTDFGDEIVLAADVFFAYNDHTLNERAHQELATVAEKLRGAGSASSLTVTGYTDSTGTASHNQGLSERRAQSVQGALEALVPDVAITAAGKGASDPVADNDTDEGRALNRRVVISAG